MGEKLRESMVYPLTTGWWRDSLSKHDQCAQHLTAVSGDFTSVRRLFAFLRVKMAIYKQLTFEPHAFGPNERKGAQVVGPSFERLSLLLLAACCWFAETRKRVEIPHQGVAPDIGRGGLRRLRHEVRG